MRRLVRQVGLPALIATGAAMLVAASSLLLAVGYHDQLGGLRHTIYQRCLQRDTYDRASQAARAAQVAYYRRLVANVEVNGAHSTFDRRLITSARTAIVTLQRTVDVGAPTGCQQYR